jgi:hypothetical protein
LRESLSAKDSFPQDDDGIGSNPGNFMHGDGEDGPKFGYKACGTSSSALEYKMKIGVPFNQAVSNAIHNAADPLPMKAGKWQGSGAAPTLVGTATSPPTQVSSSLYSTGFAPVILNPPPPWEMQLMQTLISLKVPLRMEQVPGPTSLPCHSSRTRPGSKIKYSRPYLPLF